MKKKYSIYERRRYYAKKLIGTPDKEKRAFIHGFLDSTEPAGCSSSRFGKISEKEAYCEGVKRGCNAMEFCKKVKF